MLFTLPKPIYRASLVLNQPAQAIDYVLEFAVPGAATPLHSQRQQCHPQI